MEFGRVLNVGCMDGEGEEIQGADFCRGKSWLGSSEESEGTELSEFL